MKAMVTKLASVSAKVFEIGETPVSSELGPGESALDHPASWQNDEAPHLVAPLDDLDAQQRHPQFQLAWRSSRHRPRSVRANGSAAEDQPGPSRCWIAAVWTTTRIGGPSLSTRAWILRPFIFLPAS